MWAYKIKTAELRHNDDLVAATCYSGYGAAKNDPTRTRETGIGPIPCGAYLIGAESDDEKHGPVALHLVHLTGTETYGRSGFMVHGDSRSAPGAASHGCIAAEPRKVREAMADGPDKLLIVLSGDY